MTNVNFNFDNITFEEPSYNISTGGILETGGYPATIEQVYLKESASSATFVVVNYKVNNISKSERICIRSRNGKSTYVDPNGKEHPLPGLTMFDTLCACANGSNAKLTIKSGIIKPVMQYNFESKAEEPVQTTVFPSLANKEVGLLIQKKKEFKRKLDENNQWVDDTTAPREINTIQYFLTKDMKTPIEQAKGLPAAFADQWISANLGKTLDLTGGAEVSTPTASTSDTPWAN